MAMTMSGSSVWVTLKRVPQTPFLTSLPHTPATNNKELNSMRSNPSLFLSSSVVEWSAINRLVNIRIKGLALTVKSRQPFHVFAFYPIVSHCVRFENHRQYLGVAFYPQRERYSPFGSVVGEEGFEPPTPWFVATCSNPLSYKLHLISSGSVPGSRASFDASTPNKLQVGIVELSLEKGRRYRYLRATPEKTANLVGQGQAGHRHLSPSCFARLIYSRTGRYGLIYVICYACLRLSADCIAC
ncbi:hypothetical protein M9H77_16130 [Catharanthus roseus]|uniref:Uncharacterized protein n=1 Tax=Catharanthus roseus TaxID=4058 RepID=A0ACC0B0D4_CATRO|nr:hypothetical protein M9H77_16130 [Catharanthus roseus]